MKRMFSPLRVYGHTLRFEGRPVGLNPQYGAFRRHKLDVRGAR